MKGSYGDRSVTDEAKIVERLSAAADMIGAVRKTDQNQHQGFKFRGIDAVMTACAPAFRKYQIVMSSRVLDREYMSVATSKGKQTMGVRLTVEYTFHCPHDSLTTTVVSEAMDYGDKATSKAMSMALKYALFQTLCLPTDEPDPDHDVYERRAEFNEDEVMERLEAATTVDELRAIYRSVPKEQKRLRAMVKDQADALSEVKEEA